MEKTKQQKAKDFIINNGVIIVMFILVIYTGLTSDNFLTRNNLMNILMNMSSRLVIALGIAGCVITAGCSIICKKISYRNCENVGYADIFNTFHSVLIIPESSSRICSQ